MISIQIKSISFDQDSSLDYLALKYSVFVKELGWQLPSRHPQGVVEPDIYDTCSNHHIAYVDSSNPIGIIRVTPVHRAFPYRELLERYLSPNKISVDIDRMGVLTSLAVVPAFRGQPVNYREQHLTTAKSLLWTAVDDLRKKGFDLCLLTAVEGASDKFFYHSGAYPLSVKYYLKNFSNYVRDFAILINDCERFIETSSYLAKTCRQSRISDNEQMTKKYLEALSSALIKSSHT